MISIAMLGAGRDPARYYLQQQAGCPLDYYTGRGETPGRWVGAGAQALGRTGPLTEAQGRELTVLLAGRHPDDDTELAKPVWRTDPAGLLPAAPLLAALTATAAEQDVTVEQLVGDPRLAEQITALTGRSARAATTPSLTPTDASRLATAAGLDPVQIWRDVDGTDRYAAAQAKEGRQIDVRRSGLDLTISPPKSVSVLYGLGSPETAAQVRAAHETAVGEAIAYLETYAAHGLRGHQGDRQRTDRVRTDGLVAVAFEHRTSRADDPQLHTHLVVANLLHGADGKWSAVDSRAMHRHAQTAGYLYQAALRGELTGRLGVGWTAPTKGVAEITGIPASVRRLFSTRRGQITDALQRSGGSGRAAAQHACYATRPAKSHTGETDLRSRWAARLLAETGLSPAQLEADVLNGSAVPALPDAEQLAREVLGPGGVTRQTTSFDRRQLTQAIALTLPPGAPVTFARLEALTDQLLAHSDAVPLLAGADPEVGRRYSTADLLATEQRALHLAGGNNAVTEVPPERIDAALTASRLSVEQQLMVWTLLRSGRAVDVVAGPAGTGKTSTLAQAHRLWRSNGIPVYGAALAAVAARRLEAGSGIASTSLTRLLGQLDQPAPDGTGPVGLPAGSVVVLDEAGMVGTRQLTRLLEHTSRAGGQLILVGDTGQLGEIDAGGLFTALARRDQTPALHTNQRQQHPDEQQALARLRDGQTALALHSYFSRGQLHTAHADDIVETIAVDYLTARASARTPYDVVALAARRIVVADLNTAIRRQLGEHGQLGPEVLTMGGADTEPLPLAVGDLVVGLRNDPSTGLLNGTRATVTAISTDRVGLRTDDGHPITLPVSGAADQLAHAYALTIHKAQGLTVNTCLVHSDGLDQRSGYVALSRGRHGNHLYTAGDPQRPLDSLTGLAQQLAGGQHQQLALEQHPHLRGRAAPTPRRAQELARQVQPAGRENGRSR